MLAALAIATVVTAVGQPAAPPAPPALRGPALHLRVIGDLDTSKLAADIAGELKGAGAEKTGLVVLELECRRTRQDVVWEIGQAVRESPVPVAVFARGGEGGEVASGALEIGVLARWSFITPGAVIRERSWESLAWLAPAGTDWERVRRELSGALWIALKDHGRDPALAGVLVAPSKPVWALPTGEGGLRRITDSAAAEGSPQIVLEDEAGPRLELPGALAAELGLAGAGPSDAASVARKLVGPGARTSTRTLSSELAQARRDAADAIDAGAQCAARSAELLKVRSRGRAGKIGAVDYRQAAQEAQAELERAEAHLARAESMIAALPEIARSPAASAARGGRAPEPMGAAIARVRKEIEKHRAKAAGYAAK